MSCISKDSFFNPLHAYLLLHERTYYYVVFGQRDDQSIAGSAKFFGSFPNNSLQSYSD